MPQKVPTSANIGKKGAHSSFPSELSSNGNIFQYAASQNVQYFYDFCWLSDFRGDSKHSPIIKSKFQLFICAIAPEQTIYLSNFPTSIQSHIEQQISNIDLSSLKVEKIEPKSDRPSYALLIVNVGIWTFSISFLLLISGLTILFMS